MAKSNSGGKQKNENSLSNLKVIRDSERASMLGKMGAEAKKIKQQRKMLLHDDISEIVLKKIKVPDALYNQLKQFGIKVEKTERLDRIVFYRALLKALKDGNSDQLLKIAEFAGMKSLPIITEDEEGEANQPIEFVFTRVGNGS